MWWYGRGNSGGSWLPEEKKANMWPGRGNSGGSWPPAFPRSSEQMYKKLISRRGFFFLKIYFPVLDWCNKAQSSVREEMGYGFFWMQRRELCVCVMWFSHILHEVQHCLKISCEAWTHVPPRTHSWKWAYFPRLGLGVVPEERSFFHKEGFQKSRKTSNPIHDHVSI